MQQEQAEQQAEQQAQQVEQQEEPQQGTAEAIERDQAQQDVQAAEPEIDTEATLYVATSRYTAGLDPQRSGSQTNYINGACTFEAGMSNHPETAALEPNLVAGIEIVDPTNLIMTVTDDAFFHDGSQYTAHDLEFNFQRVAAEAEYHAGGESSDHPNGWGTARGTFGTGNFSSYSVVDDFTFRVETPAPNASLAGSIMSGAVRHMSKAFVEEHGDGYVDTEQAMGTGPFVFQSHTPDVGFNWTRNDQYRRGRDGLVLPRLPWFKDLDVKIRPEPLAQLSPASRRARSMSPTTCRPTSSSPTRTTRTSRSSTGRPAIRPTTSCSTPMSRWRRSTACPTRSSTSACAKPPTWPLIARRSLRVC